VTPGTYVPPTITYNPPVGSTPTYPVYGSQGPIITTHGGTTYPPPVVTTGSGTGTGTYVPPVVTVGGGTGSATGSGTYVPPVVTVGGSTGSQPPVVTVGGGSQPPVVSPTPTTNYVPNVQIIPEDPVRYKVPRGTSSN
jgi:hypothetical protein